MIQHRRRAELHETKTGHERWLVSYSDFITLLFGFFVVMYSVSQVSEQKYRALSDTLANVFEGHVPVESRIDDVLDQYPLDNTGSVSGISPKLNLIDTQTLAKDLQELLVHLVEMQDISISATEQWVEIDVDANLLFASASADPSEEAKLIFKQVAGLLAPYDNEIEVAGHTDNLPISTSQFASNWELSAARSVSVVRLLQEQGVAPSRLSAVGFGEFRPVEDNATTQGRTRNRRVVLKVARHQPSFQQYPLRQNATEVPTEITPAESASVDQAKPDPAIEPVRLKNGGLLFTSDPELPRNGN